MTAPVLVEFEDCIKHGDQVLEFDADGEMTPIQTFFCMA